MIDFEGIKYVVYRSSGWARVVILYSVTEAGVWWWLMAEGAVEKDSTLLGLLEVGSLKVPRC